ncbi:thermonuclease family protein [Candidatus Gracilibacteria bacterium]|nr:thermonuclease family protein [Candidatus Gracilibacteria bacterium]
MDEKISSIKKNTGLVASWIFGSFFAFLGIGSIFSEPIPGIIMLIMAVTLLPVCNKFAMEKWNFHLSAKRKSLIIIIGFILFSATVPESKTPAVQTSVSSKEVQTSSGNDILVQNKQEEGEIVKNDIKIPIIPKEEIKTISASTPIPTQEEYLLVTKVVDGDTIEVMINGKNEKLRLLGVDTPETVDPRKSVECFGKESSNKANEVLLNKKVKLVSDETQGDKDKYGRLLRYVYREDGVFYNKWIIENGYAHEYTYNKPYKFQTEFKQAEKTARENQLGLWSPEICNIPIMQEVPVTTINTTTSNQQVTGGHIFYTSRHYKSVLYYCDTDLTWQSLSKSYLESYTSTTALLQKYPTKTLHEPCK